MMVYERNPLKGRLRVHGLRVGGKCDASTTVDIAPAGPGLTVKVSIQPDGQPCDAIGVAKAIRLKLAQPIPPGLVAVHQ